MHNLLVFENTSLYPSLSLRTSFLICDYCLLKILRYTNPLLLVLKMWQFYVMLLIAGKFCKSDRFAWSKMQYYTCNSFYFAVISPYIGTNPSNFARTCCLLPSSLKCRQACRKGRPEDLRKNCSEVEEVHLY